MKIWTKLMAATICLGIVVLFVGCENDDNSGDAMTWSDPTPFSLTGSWRLTDQRSPGDQWILELTEVSSSASQKQVTGILRLGGKAYTVASTSSPAKPALIMWIPRPGGGGNWQGVMTVYARNTWITRLDISSASNSALSGCYDANTGNPWSAVRM